MKLSKAQQHLLDDMKAGAIVYYIAIPGGNAFYFRGDNYSRCTATILVLLRLGLVEEFSSKLYQKKYRYKKENDYGNTH